VPESAIDSPRDHLANYPRRRLYGTLFLREREVGDHRPLELEVNRPALTAQFDHAGIQAVKSVPVGHETV